MKKSLMIVVGTRPELIKVAPVMWELKKRNIPFCFVHSNQHYLKILDEKIMHNLGIPKPQYNLHVGSASHAVQTGKVMGGVEEICVKRCPSVVIVHGDTNTTLGASLAAVKLHIPVAHIEAGLRSFDYAMPEEINRMLVDRISTVLFAPTKGAYQNLCKEGIEKKNIVITGNTIVDVLDWYRKNNADGESFNPIMKKPFILVTAHRPENVDDKKQLEKLLGLLNTFFQLTHIQILWPMHPRTKSNLEKFDLSINESGIKIIPPVDYFQMISFLKHASLVITDSGGIQEEAYILKKPLITIRNSTERPETLSANILTGLDAGKVLEGWQRYQKGFGIWNSQLGNGDASTRIVDILKTFI